jgi:hypothetical protein
MISASADDPRISTDTMPRPRRNDVIPIAIDAKAELDSLHSSFLADDPESNLQFARGFEFEVFRVTRLVQCFRTKFLDGVIEKPLPVVHEICQFPDSILLRANVEKVRRFGQDVRIDRTRAFGFAILFISLEYVMAA